MIAVAETCCPNPSLPQESSPSTPCCPLPLDPPRSSLPPPHCPFHAEFLHLRQQVPYWKAQHQRVRKREQKHLRRIAELQAEVRDLKQRLYGRKSETHNAPDTSPEGPAGSVEVPLDPANASATATVEPTAPAPRSRGQQRGAPGHKRRDYSHLPAVEEISDLADTQRRCPCCGEPFAVFPGTEDSTILEIEVRAHRRQIRRRRYQPTCRCNVVPGIITAPAPPRLIAKSPFGVSIWVTLLLDKYLFYRPTYRLLADLQTHGLDLSQGTLTGGLKRLVPLFEPLYALLIERNQQQHQWHGDETRWQVFATVEGKVGYRWYLWLIESQEAAVFVLAKGRSHEVPEKHFEPVTWGILIVDRFKAYQAIDKVKEGLIVLAFCWAHVRRDFLKVGQNWPKQQEWMTAWLERIGALYHLNERRLELREDSEGFEQRDQDLRQAVTQMEAQAKAELTQADLHPARRKVLESLGDHWTGLTVFVEHPEVPLDNNAAERSERGPVVGRKNYYGSGAVWSGQLAAMLFSLFETLRLWDVNPRAWLTWYLTACAEAGGKVPANVSQYLPWNLSEQQRQGLSNKSGSVPCGPGQGEQHDTS
jgi:transposase